MIAAVRKRRNVRYDEKTVILLVLTYIIRRGAFWMRGSIIVPLVPYEDTTMSATPQGYAKDQPAGFINRIERVAIVGVCMEATER
jgi:hypothetical protein